MRFSDSTYTGYSITYDRYAQRKSDRVKLKLGLKAEFLSSLFPIFSSLLFSFFVVLPFFFDFRVDRIRIDNFSSISELVKKDILQSFEKMKMSEFDYGSLENFLYFLWRACEDSLWARNCSVSFSLPNLVELKFDEVFPVALLVDGDKVFVVSSDYSKIQTPLTLNQVYSIGLQDFTLPFLFLKSERCDLENISKFIMYVSSSTRDIEQIVCFDFSLELYTKQGQKIILPKDDLYSSFSRFLSLKQNLGSAKEIDMRNEEKVFVR